MGVFWLFPLIPHSHCLEVRASEGDGEKRVGQARQGCLFLHNVCRCCMTRFVTLRATTSQSGTERCGRGTGGDGAGEAGPQRCPRLSKGDGGGDGVGGVIDCTAVALNYASIPSMEEAAGAKVTFLRSDYSRLLHRPLLFHPYAVALPLDGSLFFFIFFPSLIVWFDNWDIKKCIWENVWEVKMWGF